MTETGKAGIGEEHSPARRQIWIARFAAAQAPEEIDETDDHGSHQRHSEERMSEAAVMVQAEGGASEAAEDIEIRRFGSQRQRGGGEGRFAVEAGAAHGGAE